MRLPKYLQNISIYYTEFPNIVNGFRGITALIFAMPRLSLIHIRDYRSFLIEQSQNGDLRFTQVSVFHKYYSQFVAKSTRSYFPCNNPTAVLAQLAASAV